MQRLATAIVVLLAACLGLTMGYSTWAWFGDELEVGQSAAPSGSFATESLGRDWLWVGVPLAVLFGVVAMYLLRGRIARPF